MKSWGFWMLIMIAIGSLVGAFFVFQAGFGAYKRDKVLSQEIQKLEEEAQRVSAENEILEKKITYFKTDAFTEREAKEKLNLKREGERVVEVKGVEAKSDEEVKEDAVHIYSEEPIYMKWWDIFFSPYK